MLGYALDTIRATALGPGQDRNQGAHRGRDPRAAVRTARWLLFPAGLLAFLSLPLLLIYIVSLGTGLGLWPAAGVAFMMVMFGLLVDRFLPRWVFAVSTVLLGSWLVYLVAASSAGWPAGPPVLARISGWGFGVLAAFYLRDLTVSASGGDGFTPTRTETPSPGGGAPHLRKRGRAPSFALRLATEGPGSATRGRRYRPSAAQVPDGWTAHVGDTND